MKKISILDRILLLLTGLLAAYQIVVGMGNVGALAISAYTVAFGVLLVAGLLIIIIGFDVLDSPLVVIVSTIIPLSLSLGLVSQYLPSWQTAYTIFVVIGFLLVVYSRYKMEGAMAVIPLATVHGIAGMTIFLLPIIFSIQDKSPSGFFWVGIGGALIGVGGLLLAFLKSGKPILSKDIILTVLPGLLLLMTAAFVVGFAA
ncbi:MAG: hypothetical protein HN392_02350 [Anaerolineae bacterium]|jgi:hypothetical protein|nr:hypothetical protein [Anaerolineae bacterium]MBT7075935.1 hypothetical protein [Anaerolineae bacterium]MBT7783135.1 hypothetical protein [Anaerolineae bacterium]